LFKTDKDGDSKLLAVAINKYKGKAFAVRCPRALFVNTTGVIIKCTKIPLTRKEYVIVINIATSKVEHNVLMNNKKPTSMTIAKQRAKNYKASIPSTTFQIFLLMISIYNPNKLAV
jgi:hypothetical protein